MSREHVNAPPLPSRGEGRGEGKSAAAEAPRSTSREAPRQASAAIQHASTPGPLTLSLSPQGERGRDLSPWIISRSQDLLWFHGSVVAGLALLAFFVFVPAPSGLALLGLLVWGVLFDGTHVMGTYARTYLAPDDASRSALPGPWSGGLLLVGPAFALAGHAAFSWFLLGAFVWAYWHLVRQHYGFLALYRRKGPRLAAVDAGLETALLWAGCLYPYVRFSLTPAYASSGLPVLSPPSLLPLVDAGFLATILVLAVLVLGRARLGPRHLLLAVVIGFHALVFSLLHDLLAITATLTIFHNLQYHRIVWRHEAGHGRVPLGSLWRYLALGVLLGAAWYGARVLGVSLAGPGLLRDVLMGLGWGIAFHHYLVDGRIWKARRPQAVARPALATAAAEGATS